jgi:hypothetical protein
VNETLLSKGFVTFANSHRVSRYFPAREPSLI